MTPPAQSDHGSGGLRRWIADPLSFMCLLILAALALPLLGRSQTGDFVPASAVVLAAVIAGVALSGST